MKLNKETKQCFYEDGKTGKCLGYAIVSTFGYDENDEPCDYCKDCDALSSKEED